MPLSSVVGASSIIQPGVCTSTTRPASPYDGQVIYETDTNLVKAFDGTAFVTVGPVAAPAVAIFNETQASGTQGGGATSGSFIKRTLNTSVVNQITGCTLTSSVISLPAGTYEVLARAPARSVNRHKIRLQNTSDATTIAIGASAMADNTDLSTTDSILQTVFTLAATKNVELQHRVQTTRATDGFGTPSSFGDDEIYASIQIVKIA